MCGILRKFSSSLHLRYVFQLTLHMTHRQRTARARSAAPVLLLRARCRSMGRLHRCYIQALLQFWDFLHLMPICLIVSAVGLAVFRPSRIILFTPGLVILYSVSLGRLCALLERYFGSAWSTVCDVHSTSFLHDCRLLFCGSP